ncbi:MAG: transglutaminase domain-containing protein [Candidatus Hodarchaeota archaeon]
MKTKEIILNRLTILCGIGLIIIALGPLQQTQASWPISVSVNAPEYGPVITTFPVSATTNKLADSIKLYVDGVLKKTVYNTYSLTYNVQLDSADLGDSIQIKAIAFAEDPGPELDIDIKYTIAGPWFDVADPSPWSNNLGTDTLRHPSNPIVYKAQMTILEDSGYDWWNGITKQMWMDIIWSRVRNPYFAPWTSSVSWHSDVEIAEDYLTDGYIDGPTGYGYDCSNYAVFISGMARSVGLPARIWSIVGISNPSEDKHMISEIYVGMGTNNGWWPMSIVTQDMEFRVNWDTWETSPNSFREKIYASKIGSDPWKVKFGTIIWGMTDKTQLAWNNDSNDLPPSYWTPSESEDFYDIEVETGHGANIVDTFNVFDTALWSYGYTGTTQSGSWDIYSASNELRIKTLSKPSSDVTYGAWLNVELDGDFDISVAIGRHDQYYTWKYHHKLRLEDSNGDPIAEAFIYDSWAYSNAYKEYLRAYASGGSYNQWYTPSYQWGYTVTRGYRIQRVGTSLRLYRDTTSPYGDNWGSILTSNTNTKTVTRIILEMKAGCTYWRSTYTSFDDFTLLY